MVAFSRQNLMNMLPFAGGLGVGAIVAAGVLLIPSDSLESLVWTSGVASLVPAAVPPLGVTARVALAIGSGALLAAITWSVLYLMFGPGGFFANRTARAEGMPVIRRADAHPDAPPRKPMSAADLGRPMMEVVVAPTAGSERTIPADLDMPLAAFDPSAMLPVPMEAMRPVSPLVAPVVAMPVAAEERVTVKIADPEPLRIDTFELPPMIRAARPAAKPQVPASEPAAAPQSIESLLERLERGAAQRAYATAH